MRSGYRCLYSKQSEPVAGGNNSTAEPSDVWERWCTRRWLKLRNARIRPAIASRRRIASIAVNIVTTPAIPRSCLATAVIPGVLKNWRIRHELQSSDARIGSKQFPLDHRDSRPVSQQTAAGEMGQVEARSGPASDLLRWAARLLVLARPNEQLRRSSGLDRGTA